MQFTFKEIIKIAGKCHIYRTRNACYPDLLFF